MNDRAEHPKVILVPSGWQGIDPAHLGDTRGWLWPARGSVDGPHCVAGDLGQCYEVGFEDFSAAGREGDPGQAARVGAGGGAVFAQGDESGVRQKLEVLGEIRVIHVERVPDDGELQFVDVSEQTADAKARWGMDELVERGWRGRSHVSRPAPWASSSRSTVS